jgi:serine/threonine protein kinase
MPVQDEKNLSTFLYCRSRNDGTIVPAWDDSCETDLQGIFEVGRTVADRYFLKRKLGDGSMGRVFMAVDTRLDRLVAMKVVTHRSPRLGANLHHKGIAAVYDFGVHEDKSYTIFEYVEGETLRDLMQRRGKIPLDETLRIVDDLAAALDFAHGRGSKRNAGPRTGSRICTRWG